MAIQMNRNDARPRWTSATTRGHAIAWVAWGSCAFYWAAISAGYGLQLWHGTARDVLGEVGWRVAYGSCATVGAVIVSRRPHNRIGWILCTIGITSAVAGFAQDYASFAVLDRPQPLPGGLVMGWLGSWPWYIAFGLILTFLLLLFPDGQLPSRRWRPVAWLAAGAIALQTLWAAFAPRPLEGSPGMPSNPWAIEQAEALFRLLEVMPVLLSAVVCLSLASLVARFRRSRGVERQQLKWFTFGALLVAGSWAVLTPTGLGERLGGPVWFLFAAVSSWMIPGAIGIAILRYRLYDIDRIVNRTLVYGLLTVLLGGVYVSAVLVLGHLFGGVGDDPPSWVIASATLAVAALFQPARRRIQDAVDRRFNRHRYDKAKTIDAFSDRLRDHIDLDTLSTELLAVVHQTVEPTRASLWLRPQADHRLARNPAHATPERPNTPPAPR